MRHLRLLVISLAALPIVGTFGSPLVAQAPVLLVVLDGMSAAVARELLADLTRLVHEHVVGPPVAVVLPRL